MQQEQNTSAKRGRPPKVKYNVAGIPADAISAAVELEVAKRTAEIERKAEKRIKEANKRASEASGRRVWYGPDKLRAAFFAGQGKTPEQIALIIGGTTGPRVRTLLHQHGIGFSRENNASDQIMINWKKTDREMVEKPAAKRDRDPAELTALIARKVMQGGDKAIDALVSELDVIG